jgi:hypothetical protein
VAIGQTEAPSRLCAVISPRVEVGARPLAAKISASDHNSAPGTPRLRGELIVGLDGGSGGRCGRDRAHCAPGPDRRSRERGNRPMSRTFIFALACAALGSSLASLSAQAEGGCGPGFHRNPLGICRPNGAVVVAPGVAVVVAPPVRPAVVVAPPVVVAPAAVVAAPAPVVAPAVVVAPPVVCGAGFRWHPGFRRCVVL